MKRIKLTQNKYALVDNADYEWLNQYKWCAFKVKCKSKYLWYAVRSIRGRPLIFMHRQILGLQEYDGKETDHINGNGLNNRRNNLRITDHSGNMRNKKAKGVYFCRETKKWRPYISINGKQVRLGYYKTLKKAKQIRKQAVKIYYGEFARA